RINPTPPSGPRTVLAEPVTLDPRGDGKRRGARARRSGNLGAQGIVFARWGAPAHRATTIPYFRRMLLLFSKGSGVKASSEMAVAVLELPPPLSTWVRCRSRSCATHLFERVSTPIVTLLPPAWWRGLPNPALKPGLERHSSLPRAPAPSAHARSRDARRS